MTGMEAVTKVTKAINEAALTDFSGCAYKYEKPDNIVGEYIAVNNLPFIHQQELYEGTVNVNVHVPKTPSNEPNTKRLAALASEVEALFPEDTMIDGAYYEFYSDSRPQLDADGTYYVNLQIKVTYSELSFNR